uniref:Phage tail fiber protein n=1 Tax=Panagrellus redivivus TaxID=6233 RepID=A0A7E4VS64_PANRE
MDIIDGNGAKINTNDVNPGQSWNVDYTTKYGVRKQPPAMDFGRGWRLVGVVIWGSVIAGSCKLRKLERIGCGKLRKC